MSVESPGSYSSLLLFQHLLVDGKQVTFCIQSVLSDSCLHMCHLFRLFLFTHAQDRLTASPAESSRQDSL